MILSLAWVACGQRRASPDLDVTLDLAPSEPLVGRATVASLLVRDALGGPVREAQLDLEGHMTHPGMAPVVVPLRAEGDGRYRAAVTLTMGGEWVMFISGRLADGRAVRQRVVTVTASEAQ